MRARFLRVGTTRPVSNCERKLAERPTSCPSSTRPMERFNRSRRIFTPIFLASMEASAVASSTVSTGGLVLPALTIVSGDRDRFERCHGRLVMAPRINLYRQGQNSGQVDGIVLHFGCRATGTERP